MSHSANCNLRAFILAGGLGTRLRPVVDDRPKPLAPVGDAPFLEHQIEHLRSQGVTDFVLCVGYRSEQIREHFEDGSRWGVSIRYSLEETPLGTGGALKQAESCIDDTFLLLNGDTFFDAPLAELIAAHGQNRRDCPSCVATLALTPAPDPKRYGAVVTDDDGRILEFHEKNETLPAPQQISAGLYVMEPQILQLIPAAQPVSLEKETFPAAMQSGRALFGWSAEGYFVDIGTPEGYHRFCDSIGDFDRWRSGAKPR